MPEGEAPSDRPTELIVPTDFHALRNVRDDCAQEQRRYPDADIARQHTLRVKTMPTFQGQMRSSRPPEEAHSKYSDRTTTTRLRNLKLAGATPDPNWLTFRDHEILIQDEIVKSFSERDLATEWADIADQDAYVQSVDDITAARQVSEPRFQQAHALNLTNLDKDTWPNGQVVVVRRAFQSLQNFLQALQQFTNASRTSRAWANDQEQVTKDRIRYLQRVIDKIGDENGDGDGDGDGDGNGHGNGNGNGNGDGGGGEEEEEEEEEEEKGEEDDDDVRHPDPRASKRKRDEHRGAHHADPEDSSNSSSKSSRSSAADSDAPTSARLNQKRRPLRGDMAEDAPLEPDPEYQTEFDKSWNNVWTTIRCDTFDTWFELYMRARRMWKAGGPPEYPNGSDDAALAEFQARINKTPEPAVGRAWQSRIDKINVDEDDTHQKLALQLAKEAAVQRARDNRTDVWPSPRISPRKLTGAEAAARIGFDGDSVGIQGHWAYLSTIGQGAQGEAGLWMSRRIDGNGNLIDVSTCTTLPPAIKFTWQPYFFKAHGQDD